MKKYLNQIVKWLAVAVVVITIIQANTLAANAEVIFPGDTFEGPLVPQFEIMAVNCGYSDVGTYTFEVYGPNHNNLPLSDRNFVPCSFPWAIDSYFPSGTVDQDYVIIKNIGEVPINVEPVFL